MIRAPLFLRFTLLLAYHNTTKRNGFEAWFILLVSFMSQKIAIKETLQFVKQYRNILQKKQT